MFNPGFNRKKAREEVGSGCTSAKLLCLPHLNGEKPSDEAGAEERAGFSLRLLRFCTNNSFTQNINSNIVQAV